MLSVMLPEAINKFAITVNSRHHSEQPIHIIIHLAVRAINSSCEW